MSILEKTRNWTEILKNVAIIGVIVFGVLWAGLSVWANIAEPDTDNPAGRPSIEGARYKFTVSYYEPIYTNKYESLGDGIYVLKRFYAQKDGKFRLYKIDLRLDEKVTGKIIIEDRTSK